MSRAISSIGRVSTLTSHSQSCVFGFVIMWVSLLGCSGSPVPNCQSDTVAGQSGSDPCANTGGTAAGGAGLGGLVNGGTSAGGSASGGVTSTLESSTGGAATGGVATTGTNAGAAGAAGAATGGTGGSSLTIVSPTLPIAHTYAYFSASVSASGGNSYSWSIANGTLPAGIALADTTSAAVQLLGMPKEVGIFPITLAVTDGVVTQSIDLQIEVGHRIAFTLNPATTTSSPQLYLTEVGTKNSLPVYAVGPGASSFAWSPDGTKIAHYSWGDLAGNSGSLYVTLAGTHAAYRVDGNRGQFAWLANGRVLTYSNYTKDRLLMVDVSGAPPWNPRVVAFPAPISTCAISVTGISQRSVVDGAVVTVNLGGTCGNSYTTLYVDWNSGSPMVTSLRSGDASGAEGIQFSSDGRFLVLQNSAWPLDVIDLSVPTAPVTAPLEAAGNSLAWSPNSQALITTAASNTGVAAGLNLHRFVGDAWVTSKLTSLGNAGLPQWSPDGNHAVFLAGSDVRGIANVLNAGANSDFSLVPAVDSFGTIYDFRWSPNSEWVAVYGVKPSTSGSNLYFLRWETAGVTPPYPLVTSGSIFGWLLSPDSTRVAFTGEINGAFAPPNLYVGQVPASTVPTDPVALTNMSCDVNVGGWLAGSRVLLYSVGACGAAGHYSLNVINIVASTYLRSTIPESSNLASWSPAP